MATTKTTANETKTRAPRKEWSESEKRNNFKSAAGKRTNRTIKSIRALSGVARTSRYAWTDAEAAKILGALATELRNLEARFQNPGKRSAEEFTL